MTDLLAAADAVERLARELDITNADHIALWLEANMNDSTLGWLACRIIEAHEQVLALHALQQPERCAPCRHEWFEGRCIHCEITAKDFRAAPPEGEI